MSEIKIAIIEDDQTSQDYLELIMKKICCSHIRISDPKIAIKTLREELPDLVLLDIKLSGEISGCDIAQNMKQDDQLKNIPIIVVSAFAMEDEIKEISMNTKCDGYITKPFLMDDLINAIDLQLEKIALNAESSEL
jgi:two-component system cell cycle response regulator DivK